MFEKLFSQSGLSLDRLRSLTEVDRVGSIVGAAPGDTVRQSQISRNLGQLEEFFGLELKRRKGKGIELTTEGKRLAALARLHLQSMEDFLGEASRKPCEIRIGASQSTLEWILIPQLTNLPAEENEFHPRYFLENLRSHEIIHRLNDFSLDLGIVRKTAITTKRIRFRPLAEVRYALFAHPAARKRHRDHPLEIIRHTPLATSMGGEYRRVLEEHLVSLEIEPDFRYSCSSFRAALELLKSDRKIAAILPDAAAVELEGTGIEAIALSFLQGYRREIGMAWHERIDDLRPGVVGFRKKLGGLTG